MAGKTFAEGVKELKHLVGSGVLEGTISVNQVYAHYQDDGHGPHGMPAALFDHPRGGEAAYLSGQMVQRRNEVMQRWANAVLRGRLVHETIDMMQTIRDSVYLRAPRQFDILRNSTTLKLLDHRAPAFFSPAMMPRLSQAELNAIRKAGDPSRSATRVLVRRYK